MSAESPKEDEMPEEEYWRVKVPKPSVIIRKAGEILERFKTPRMRCSGCGKPVSPGFKVCPYCGTPVTAAPHAAPTVCQKCGKELSPDYKVCPDCGTPVTITVPSAPTPAQSTPVQPPSAQQVPTPSAETYTPNQAMAIFKDLKARFESGTLEKEEYKSQLKTFKFSDDSGRYWTVGAQSEEWYYHDGKTWVKGTPTGTLQRSAT